MTKKIKVFSFMLTIVLLLPIFSTVALADPDRGFYGYLLPAYKGMNYTSTYEHADETSWIDAKVTQFTNTSKCYLWGADIYEQPLTSTGITFTANNTWKSLYFSDGETHEWEYMSLGMMNYYSQGSGAWVDGVVDFYEY